MSKSVKIITTVESLRTQLLEWRQANLTVGLVPTMGNLHLGHYSLVEQSVKDNDRTCVSVFVNPKQFGDNEDFSDYPRSLDSDEAGLSECGVNLMFAPSIREMYQDGFVTRVSVPGIGEVLEGEFREGFFIGVATVITKLLVQVFPDRAYFGEKDYQQLCVIKRICADLNFPTEIIACPTVRAKDGLALSSRNSLLNPQELLIASNLYKALNCTAGNFRLTGNRETAIILGKELLKTKGFDKIDYISICDPDTLKPLTENNKIGRVFGAAWLGSIRLIDNVKL